MRTHMEADTHAQTRENVELLKKHLDQRQLHLIMKPYQSEGTLNSTHLQKTLELQIKV